MNILPPHAAEIERWFGQNMTRAKMRRVFWLGTGRDVPRNANLRQFVAAWHAHQQAINGGMRPSRFWRGAVGLPSEC